MLRVRANKPTACAERSRSVQKKIRWIFIQKHKVVAFIRLRVFLTQHNLIRTCFEQGHANVETSAITEDHHAFAFYRFVMRFKRIQIMFDGGLRIVCLKAGLNDPIPQKQKARDAFG